jgi:hypothetical protein
MPPPVTKKARKLAGRLGQNESSTSSLLSNRSDRDSESLFVRQEEEDRQWDPKEYDNEEESLGWNATIDNVRSFVVFDLLLAYHRPGYRSLSYSERQLCSRNYISFEGRR